MPAIANSRRSRFSLLLLTGLAALCFGPFIVLLAQGFSIPVRESATWAFISQSLLPQLIGNTVFLIVFTGLGATVLGTLTAALVTLSNLPGKKWFSYLFLLPISFPLYLISYIYVGAFEFSGAIPSFMRESLGLPIDSLITIKSGPGLIFVFTLALYPYVYLLAKSAFLKMGEKMVLASRALGQSPWQTFYRVVLPYALPWIFTGASLAMMEALADFGGVSLFQFDTFTTAIYTSWLSLYSLSSAARLSCFLIVFALVLYAAEAKLSSKGRHTTLGLQPLTTPLFHFGPLGKSIALIISIGIVLLGVGFPALQLILWLPYGLAQEDVRTTLSLGLQTLTLALTASLVTLLCALVMIYARKLYSSKLVTILSNLSLLGYALPGTLIAVAVFLFFQFFGLSLGNSLVLLYAGLAIRFLTIGYRPLLAGLRGISPNVEKAARSLGSSPRKVLQRVTLPMLTPSVLASLMLLFIEVVKEMPITLMLRPFGYGTLSTRLYELTAEGEWERASLSGFFILLIGLLGPWLLSRLGDRL